MEIIWFNISVHVFILHFWHGTFGRRSLRIPSLLNLLFFDRNWSFQLVLREYADAYQKRKAWLSINVKFCELRYSWGCSINKINVFFCKGADIEIRDKAGKTSLLIALYECNNNIAEYLIKHGSDVNATDSLGHSALFIAINTLDKGCVKIASKLLKAGKYWINNY